MRFGYKAHLTDKILLGFWIDDAYGFLDISNQPRNSTYHILKNQKLGIGLGVYIPLTVNGVRKFLFF
jgi:hypothetical protein